MNKTKYYILNLILIISTSLVFNCTTDNQSRKDKNNPVIQITEFGAPTELVKNAITHEQVNWYSINYDKFRIYYEKETEEEKNITFIAKSAKEGYENALRFTKEEFRKGIHLFMVPDRDIMSELIDNRSSGWSEPNHYASFIVFTANDVMFVRKRILRHEIFHVVSINLWGWTETWMQEGSAIAFDGAYVSDQMGAYLHKNGELVAFNNIITDFFNQKPTIAYLQSGIMFRYIYENYGIDKTKLLWQEGTGAMKRIIGLNIEEFENEFLQYLESIDITGFQKTIPEAFEIESN